ncbi:unnamed protein product [Adineta steineri]|uniref:Uncharacterized protein n=1 Tax=Adineta steineri TaxID=433720 RepID=A0A813U890_9BILA|nr:unnamed protein product [Adineta steineri]CAF0819752.1 unnamed protein product [Adineta steineri]
MTEITVDNLNNNSEINSRNLSLYPREIIFTDKQRDAIVCIEGPFSTCTSHIFDCEHVVLVGAGIGTPSTSNSQSRYLDIHLYCTSIRSNEQFKLENLQLRTPTHVG